MDAIGATIAATEQDAGATLGTEPATKVPHREQRLCAVDEKIDEPESAVVLQQPLLQIRVTAGFGKRRILDNLQGSIRRGEVLGVVGASGAGKSTLVNAILGLHRWNGGYAEGEVWFKGSNLLALRESEMRRLRGREIALIPQSPLSALNPALSIGRHLEEVWRAHRSGRIPLSGDRVRALLAQVHLPQEPEFLTRKPAAISVGQAQRVLIVTALLHQPSLLIADEPTSALDPITQAEILRLLGRVSASTSTAMLYISHDLLSVMQLCHRIAILDEGRFVECKEPRDLIAYPEHPYTRALLASLPIPAPALLQHVQQAGASKLPVRAAMPDKSSGLHFQTV
jgi:ABC-type glutathione transport system ATPase component